MAYRADIEIGVKGVRALEELRSSINKTAEAAMSLNSVVGARGGLVQNIQNYVNNLNAAAQALRYVGAGTQAETKAVREYVQALGEANTARARQNALIAQQIASQRKVTPSNAGFGQQGPALPPALIKSKEVQQSWNAFFTVAAETAEQLKNTAAARTLNTRTAWNKFFADAESVAQMLRAETANKALQIKTSWNSFFTEAAEVAQSLRASAAAVRAREEAASAAARGRLAADVARARGPEPRATSGAYKQPIGPAAPAGAGLAALLYGMGMPTFGAGVGAAGRGVTAALPTLTSLGGKAAAGLGKFLPGVLPGAIISGAFPLLTGQGVEAAAGGGIGGLAGGILGSVLGPGGAQMGSFAGGLVGSIIGERVGEAKKLTKELQAQLTLNNSIEMSEQRLLGLKKDILTAQTQGNELLANELERRRANAEVATQLFKTLSELDKGRDGKTKEEQALVDAEKQRAYQAAQVVVQQNNITAALERQKILYNEQLATVRHQAQLVQGQIALEKQRATMGASLVQARSQAEIAVNNVILQRLEYELQSTTNAQDRARLIREIYNLEVANAAAAYQASVAQIESQTQLVELAYKEQEAKLASLQVELAIAEAKDQEVTNFVRAIELQQQAIRLAAENVGYTRLIAAEQLRGADATYRAAVQAAALKAETAGAAQAAMQFAGSMQQAATAAAAVAAVLPKEPRTLAGLDAAQGPGFGTAVGGMPFGQAMRARFAQGRAEILGSGYGVGRNEMRAAIGRYTPASTEAANVNPQVNVTTGPVMQMDGTNYVTQRDLMSATQSAARQGANMALGSLRSDPATRRSLGLAR